MKFFAFIKPKSQLDRRWRGISVQASLHLGVVFRRNPINGRFESEELSEDQVAKITKTGSQDLTLEAFETLPNAFQSPSSQ